MGEKTRPLGEKEQLLSHLHVHGGLIAMQVLHVRGRLDPELVKRALAWLQTQHPILRAHIRYGKIVWRHIPFFAYRQPWFDTEGTTEIPLKVLDDSDPDAWRTVFASDIRTPISKGNHPRLRVTLVRQSPDADLNHIVICADHATLDAQSANNLACQLLEYLADPAAAQLKFPLHTALPPPIDTGMLKKSGSGKKTTYTPAIRLPKQAVPDPKKETRVLARHLEPVVTATLVDAIKANRTTVHGAVTAAFLLAMRERYGLDAMTVLTTVDLRRLSKVAVTHETYGCYVDILRTEHPITDDFWATARDASFKLIAALAKDQESASIMKFPGWKVYRREVGPSLRNNRRLDGLAVTTTGDSGLQASYGAYTLEDVTKAVSLDMFGPSLFVIANERLGGLDLSVGYSAIAMSDDEVCRLTDNAVARLERAG
ncbi:phthiocerol/phthiodiolone dimycocerosyl transferase family protein [Nocardia sp. CA-151230]|uniref:phthiocerol/phthiodiolone dimycocerosyl transferase family protein n=1 Tax=Nocardia sp. CA-151230 TaxID=3239982 RepID=UPI003D9164B5